MNKVAIFLVLVFSLACQVSNGQSVKFKTYTNTKEKFSFDVPITWVVKYSKEELGSICVPVTKAEIAKYKNCYEGIVFRLTVYNNGLDKSLTDEGYTKTGDTYFTTDKVSQHVKADNITGKNWKGIFHNNVCGINCKSGGSAPGTGKCQFLYFSNDKTTVAVTTNGKEFSPEILARIKSSFRFQ